MAQPFGIDSGSAIIRQKGDTHKIVANGCQCHVSCVYCEGIEPRSDALALAATPCYGRRYHPSGAEKVDLAKLETYVVIGGHRIAYEPVDLDDLR